MNVDDVVAEKIEAARIRIAAAKRRRDELSAARRRGLAARHATKLRHLAARDHLRGAANKVPNTVTNPDGNPGDVSSTDPTSSIRPTDPTPADPVDLTHVQAQLARIAGPTKSVPPSGEHEP